MSARIEIVAPRVVAPEAVACSVVAPTIVGPEAPADPLAALSDSFSGGSLDPKWTLYEGSGNATLTVAGGVLRFEIDSGSASGSFWYNEFQGDLVHQTVTGNFDVVATLTVRDAAGTALPPTDNFRLAGIAAHDPDRASNLNYVHVALGATSAADLRCEWKTTVANVSTYDSVSWPSGTGQIRLVREDQLFSAYVRATSSDAWTLVQAMDRTANPLPATLQVGPMVYSNLALHDILGDYDAITFATAS